MILISLYIKQLVPQVLICLNIELKARARNQTEYGSTAALACKLYFILLNLTLKYV